MKLDRNIKGGHGNKYGLIKNRRLEELRDASGSFPPAVEQALFALTDAGVLDWGCTPETEFFVMRLKDRYSRCALHTYAEEAHRGGDIEYAGEVSELALRAGVHNAFCKRPD